jgi:N-acetylneuraminic acid mutarotase
MIVYGGQLHNHVLSDLWFFDFRSKEWRSPTATFPARSMHRAVIAKDFMIVIGGYITLGMPVAEAVFAINLLQWQWFPLNPVGNYLMDMIGHAACVSEGKVIVFGGYQNQAREKKPRVFNAMLEMEIPLEIWNTDPEDAGTLRVTGEADQQQEAAEPTGRLAQAAQFFTALIKPQGDVPGQ